MSSRLRSLRDLRVATAPNSQITKAASLLTRAAARTGLDPARLLVATRRTSQESPDQDYFAVMMDLDVSRIAPWFMRDARKSVYMFDAVAGTSSRYP